jgi:hypothetical protein
MSESHDTPHETNLYTEYLLVDAFEVNDPSADFFALMITLFALRPALKSAPHTTKYVACGRLDV